MDILDAIQWLIALAIAFIPWFFPDISLRGKLEIILLVVAISLLVYCVRLLIRLKLAERKLDEVRQRHNALSIQFDKKVERERRYRRAFQTLSLVLHISLQNTKEAKLKDIYETFISIQDEINNV